MKNLSLAFVFVLIIISASTQSVKNLDNKPGKSEIQLPVDLTSNSDLQLKLKNQNPQLFIENKGELKNLKGESQPTLLFSLRKGNLNIYLSKNSISYVVSKGESRSSKGKLNEAEIANKMGTQNREKVRKTITHRFDVELVGANTNAIILKDDSSCFFETHYNTKYQQSIKSSGFRKIIYKNIYPHIDWVINASADDKKSKANTSGIEYDFIVHPGGDPKNIRLHYMGVDNLQIHSDGSLHVKTSICVVIENTPLSLQGRDTIVNNFKLNGNVVNYNVAAYNSKLDLIIDPIVEWGVETGGSSDDYANSCATDLDGNVYIAGQTNSIDFPVTVGAAQSYYSVDGDAFLSKYNSTGEAVWITYLGGDFYDYATSCATDLNGNIFIAGTTNSNNFAVTNGAAQPKLNNFADAFLSKFNSKGELLFSTFYGGELMDNAKSCIVDLVGNVFIVGNTNSINFPVTPGAAQTIMASGYNVPDAFVVKFSNNGNVMWATYLGGDGEDKAYSCAISKNGNIHVTGNTTSGNFPVSPGAIQSVNKGGYDAFLATYNSNGLRLWSTYYGSVDDDFSQGCSTDLNGNIFVTGFTPSANFPVSMNAAQINSAGYDDAFLLKFGSEGGLIWATYCGGSYEDYGYGCATDAEGNVYLTGQNISYDFPVSWRPQNIEGFPTSMIVKYDPGGKIIWSTKYGKKSHSYEAYSCVTDLAGNIFIAGGYYNWDEHYYYPYQIFLLKIAGTNDNYWIGNASVGDNTAWENPLNWSSGHVPDETTRVYINTFYLGMAVINYPIINTPNAICHSLYAGLNASLTVSPGTHLTVLEP